MGNTDYIFDGYNPEYCQCTQQAKNDDTRAAATGQEQVEVIQKVTVEAKTTSKQWEEVTREVKKSEGVITSPKVGGVATMSKKPELETKTNNSSMGGDDITSRVTSNFMKIKRRLQWEIDQDWEDEDVDRRIDSTEALEEDLQDFSKPMVIIGGDVVSLYPNLDTEKIVENLADIIRESGIKWSNVDMMEGVRYLALNWSREQVRNSNLKRIIPWRRSRKGVKPGMRGVGPHGKEPGDQEQWEFPSVVLEDWEREQVIIEVI